MNTLLFMVTTNVATTFNKLISHVFILLFSCFSGVLYCQNSESNKIQKHKTEVLNTDRSKNQSIGLPIVTPKGITELQRDNTEFPALKEVDIIKEMIPYQESYLIEDPKLVERRRMEKNEKEKSNK